MIIKIDKKSVKKNPNAGVRDFIVPGRSSEEKERYIKIGQDIWHEILVDGIIHIKDKVNIKNVVYNLNPLLKGEIDELIIKHSFTRPTTRMHSLTPEPDYFFKYIPTKIKCESCKKSTLHTEIESDCMVDGDGDDYEINKCPKCGELDSFGNLKFEDIDEVTNDRH